MKRNMFPDFPICYTSTILPYHCTMQPTQIFLIVFYDAVSISDYTVPIVRWLLNVKIWKETVMA